MAHEQLLAETDFFRGLSEEQLAHVSAVARRRALVRGDVLFEEGDTAGELFIVVDGRVAITQSREGRETVFALMERGSLFGEMGMLDGGPRSADARVLEPSTVLAIPYAPVRALFDEQPSLLWGVVRMLSGRLRDVDEALADSVFLDVTGRTAKWLLELAGDRDEFTLPVTQEELAGLVGASRERVNKAISAFVRLGWLSQQDRRYRILQRDRLTLRSR